MENEKQGPNLSEVPASLLHSLIPIRSPTASLISSASEIQPLSPSSPNHHYLGQLQQSRNWLPAPIPCPYSPFSLSSQKVSSQCKSQHLAWILQKFLLQNPYHKESLRPNVSCPGGTLQPLLKPLLPFFSPSNIAGSVLRTGCGTCISCLEGSPWIFTWLLLPISEVSAWYCRSLDHPF